MFFFIACYVALHSKSDSYGHGGMVSSPHFFLGKLEQRANQYFEHILRHVTDNKVSKGAKIRNRYNQVPHLTQDTNGKVTTHSKTPQTRAKWSALSKQVTTRHILREAHTYTRWELYGLELYVFTVISYLEK